MISPVPIVFALLALSAGACAIAVHGAWVRAGSFCLTVVLAAALWQTSLGRPRPAVFEAPTGTVVGFHFDEPRAIYLWMLPAGARAPTAFALPWSERQAAQLQQAAEQARKDGEPLQARRTDRPTGPMRGLRLTAQDSLRFYPAEHQALPPKAMATE